MTPQETDYRLAAALNGKRITVDGSEGEVREGILESTAWSEQDSPELQQLADIARRFSPLRDHAAGDHPLVTMLAAIQQADDRVMKREDQPWTS
jgi:pyruvate, orthophosphate dikinase